MVFNPSDMMTQMQQIHMEGSNTILTVILVILAAVYFLIFYRLWYMKRWPFFAYIALTVLTVIDMVQTRQVGWHFFWEVAVIVIIAIYYKQLKSGF